MKYRLAIFDLDGTILDTLEDLKNSINFALLQFGFPERELSEVRAFVGNGILKLVKRAVPSGTSEEDINRVFETFKSHYKIHSADNTKSYCGINELLGELKKGGTKLAVVSNKADFAVQDLCEKYFKGIFNYAVGEKENVRKKPYPDSVNEVLKTLGVPKNEAVYIGDSEVDVKTAVNVGMDCISVLWGFRSKEELLENGAKNLVSDPKEIIKYF